MSPLELDCLKQLEPTSRALQFNTPDDIRISARVILSLVENLSARSIMLVERQGKVGGEVIGI